MLMRSLRWTHRWVGLVLAIPLLLQGLSGAILTVEPYIPSFGHPPVQTGPGAPLNDILAAAAAASPPGMLAVRFTPPEAPGHPAIVRLAPGGNFRAGGVEIPIDPVTAKPAGPPEKTGGVMEFLRRFHENWLMQEWGGRQLVGWVGVALLTLTLLGIPLWWPRPGQWKDGFTIPRQARGLRLHRRLHGALGIWMAFMLVATSTTGIIQGFPQTSRAWLGIAGGPPRGGPPRGGRGGNEAEAAPHVDLDAAMRQAATAAPGQVLRVAMIPARGGEPVRLILGPPGTDGVTTSTTLMVDPAGRRVISTQTPASLSGGETVLRWAHDLHFGQGFGVVWWALTVLVGLALPIFSVTGFLMWLLKRRNRARINAEKQAARDAALQAGE